MERLPVNILLFHQQMKAKDLEEVFKHEAEPVFSRSPITGRCAYDLPGMVKPTFIRRKTPALDGIVDDPSSKSDIVGQPRIRCPTRQGLVELQRANLESIIKERRMIKGTSDNVNGLMDMAKRQGKDGMADDGVGALEALRRLREVADNPIYTEVQAETTVPGTSSDSRSRVEMRRDPSASIEVPLVVAKSSASDLPVTPFSKPATPRIARGRTPRDDLTARSSPAESQNARDSLPSTPSRQRKMAPPAQKAWKRDSSPSSRGSKEARWEHTWKDVFGPAEERPSTVGSAVSRDELKLSTIASAVSKDDRPISAASLSSQEARPASLGFAESEAVYPEVAVSREIQQLLAPVREGDENDETNVAFLASLGIPPATPHNERRAYFLEGFSPRQLPPLGVRNRWKKQPPQVMVLETPPPSGGGGVEIAPQTAPQKADADLGHFDPGRHRLKEQLPSTWPVAKSPRMDLSPKLQVRASPRLNKKNLPKQAELPKNKPAGNFYVGGKPIFASK